MSRTDEAAAAPLEVLGLGWGHPERPQLGVALQLLLRAGEALALVGPNGVGKTTLLRTLAGQLVPRQGRVLLCGEDPRSMRAEQRARRVALLPQAAVVDPDLTVVELVELGRTAHLGTWGRMRAADRDAVHAALVACELTASADRRLGRLSGGERQRAQIAMILAQGAPLLLLDEPTSHLDLRQRYLLFELLARLRGEQQLAMVLVLHDLVDAFGECDRLLVLAAGRAAELPARPRQAEIDLQHVRQQLAQTFDVPLERIPRLGERRLS